MVSPPWPQRERRMNMSHHDPAGCQRPICPECDAYNHDLAAGCGCEPCKTARIVRARP